MAGEIKSIMENNEDLEDGEIEDDEEETVKSAAQLEPAEATENDLEALAKSDQDLRLLNPIPPVQPNRNRHHKHDKKKRTTTDPEEDWAGNVEKAIAQIIKKDIKEEDDDYESDDKRRGKKRRRDRERDRKNKRRRTPPEQPFDLPRFPSQEDEEIDEDEMLCIRGGSPKQPPNPEPPIPMYPMDDPSFFGPFGPNDPYDSQSSEYDSDYHEMRNKNPPPKEKDNNRKRRKRKTKSAKNREKRREEQKVLQDSNSVCTFYMQGKCLKHLESAPKEILGDFPRLSREGAMALVNATQKKLSFDNKPSSETTNDQENTNKTENKRSRNRPSRWGSEKEQIDISQIVRQIHNNVAPGCNVPQSVFDTLNPQDQQKIQVYNMIGFGKGDKDMRVVSNGDIDMRGPPPEVATPSEPLKDQDMRVLPPVMSPPAVILPLEATKLDDRDDTEEERDLEIDEPESADDLPENLPSKQRELFMRIKAQQKENLAEEGTGSEDDTGAKDDDWYSDDEDDDTPLKNTDVKLDTKPSTPPTIEPLTLPSGTQNLADFSKVDISAQVTKLLSLVKTQAIQLPANLDSTTIANIIQPPPVTTQVDPRQKARPDPRKEPAKDPRTKRNSIDNTKSDKLTIYELGALDTDQRTRTDTDLRGLPFKPIENYIPATEINASIASHPPIPYRVHICEIPRPDYSGLKLSAADAQTSSDPRVRKIFRLATPKVIPEIASPEPSPKSEPPSDPRSERVVSDPRMRPEPKIETILPNPSIPPPMIDPWNLNQKMVGKDPVLSAVLNNLNYQMPPSLLGPGPGPMGYPPGGGLLGHSPFQNPFFGGAPPDFDKRGFRGRGGNRGGNWNNNRGGRGNRRGFQNRRGNRGGRSRTPP